MTHLPPAPTSGPLLSFLVAGFILLAAGLVALTVRRRLPAPFESSSSTRRALLWVVFYGLCSACFARVLQPALLGRDHSPWLLALGDVIAVTLALYAWVMLLAENHRFSEYGLRGDRVARIVFFTLVAIAPFGLYLAPHVTHLLTGRVRISPDSLVFACVYSVLGSAFPEEVLFRGYLMGSIGTRMQHWARIALPAFLFTAVRAVRFLPGPDLTMTSWLFYVFGLVLPLGVWWGVVRNLSRGSLWPSLVSHALLQFVMALDSASAPPAP